MVAARIPPILKLQITIFEVEGSKVFSPGFRNPFVRYSPCLEVKWGTSTLGKAKEGDFPSSFLGKSMSLSEYYERVRNNPSVTFLIYDKEKFRKADHSTIIESVSVPVPTNIIPDDDNNSNKDPSSSSTPTSTDNSKKFSKSASTFVQDKKIIKRQDWYDIKRDGDNSTPAAAGGKIHVDIRIVVDNYDALKDILLKQEEELTELGAFWKSYSDSDNHDQLFQALTEQAERYIPANVYFFGFRKSRSSIMMEEKDTKNNDKSSSSSVRRTLDDTGGYSGGAFTAAMIETMGCMDSDKGMTYRDALVMLRSILDSNATNNGLTNQTPFLASSRIMDMDDKFRIGPDNKSGDDDGKTNNADDNVLVTRRALLIGITYKGTASATATPTLEEENKEEKAQKSHNDVKRMVAYLKYAHGFQDEHITIVMDDDAHTKPTKKNILKTIRSFVQQMNPGDAAVCYYSGCSIGRSSSGVIRNMDTDNNTNNNNNENNGNKQTITSNEDPPPPPLPQEENPQPSTPLVIIPVDVEENGPISETELFEQFVFQIPKAATVTILWDGHDYLYSTIQKNVSKLELPFMFSSPDDMPESLCHKKPDFFPQMAHAQSIRNNLTNNNPNTTMVTVEEEEEEEKDEDIISLQNSLPFQYENQALKEQTELFQQSEEYINADICLFASCDDDVDSNAQIYSHHGEDDDDDVFQIPDGSKLAGGLFTKLFLKYLNDNTGKKTMSNREVLLHLGQELSAKGYQNEKPVLSVSLPHSIHKPFQIVPQHNFTGTRRAVLIGIRYLGDKERLHASHLNVYNVWKYLVDVEKFKEEDIAILMDDGQHKLPMRQNILDVYKNLTQISEPGDAVFCYFTGHGGQVEDDDDDEDDGYDETILPLDVMHNGPIRDDVLFKTLVWPMPKGVKMTCIFDCSHSGSVLDLPFTFSQQLDGTELLEPPSFSHMKVIRQLQLAIKIQKELESFWESIDRQAADEQKGIQSIDNDSQDPDDIRRNMHDILIKLITDHSKTYIEANVRLFSACQDDQCAKDLDEGYFDIPSAENFIGGAYTNAFIDTMKYIIPRQKQEKVTNRDVLQKLRFELYPKGFKQNPLMSSSRINDLYEEFKIVPDDFAGTRRAVMVGINYTNSQGVGKLRGSHNDVRKMITHLKEEHGFEDENFTILMDDDQHTQPTRRNICMALKKLANESQSGDVVFFHFSGHGGQIEDRDGDEEDGLDETLIPIDVKKNGPIRDDLLFKTFVCPMASGVTATCVFDCCHSGTGLDLPFTFARNDSPYDLIQRRPRFFPHMALAKSLRDVNQLE